MRWLIRSQFCPASVERKKPPARFAASMMAYTVLPLAGETASPIFPISSVGRPLVSLLHVAPASTDFQIADPGPPSMKPHCRRAR